MISVGPRNGSGWRRIVPARRQLQCRPALRETPRENGPAMPQLTLFADDDAAPPPAAGGVRMAVSTAVGMAVLPEAVHEAAAQLRQRYGGRLYLGTSSWNFPGWAGQVWDHIYAEATLSRQGLAAYAQHPMLNTVSLDRAFYRPLEEATYRGLAAQVPAGFRFVVKAPSQVSDALLRAPGSGAALGANPFFLDPEAALSLCVRPAVAGMGDKLGVLVWQISPLPRRWLADEAALLKRLESLWRAVLPALPPGVQLALELRDAKLLTPALAASLKAHGVRCALGLHDRMPSAEDQLPMLRATWPGDLVCRWNLQRGLRYTQARESWKPFDRIQAPDEATRLTLVKLIEATLAAGYRVYITINNKAEGSAPASLLALAMALLDDTQGKTKGPREISGPLI